jgi:hypothetical protein
VAGDHRQNRPLDLWKLEKSEEGKIDAERTLVVARCYVVNAT